MHRALRSVIGKSGSVCVSRWRPLPSPRPSSSLINTLRALLASHNLLNVASYTTNSTATPKMTPSRRELPVMNLVDGRVPMSLFEPQAFLDFDKYERTLKIVKER